MGSVRHRIGIGNINRAKGGNSINQNGVVGSLGIMTADRTDITADSTKYTADRSFVSFTADSTMVTADTTIK